MARWTRLLAGIALALAATLPARAAEIYLPLLDMAPLGYTDAQGQPSGIGVELIRELGRRAGLPVRVELMPRRRLEYEQANNPAYTAALLAGAAEVPVRYDRLGIVATYHIVLAQPPGHNATGIDAYLGRKVGLVEALSVLLPPALQRKVDTVTIANIGEGLHMLAARRIDGWLTDEVVYRANLATFGYGPGDFGGLIPVMEMDTTFFVNRDGALAADRDRLARALAAMAADGAGDRIVADHAVVRR
jgi:ABC-type amino acid transport substrate-binding protein